MTRVVYMGSAEFSVPSLLALSMAFDVVGVVTQPDRRSGRGRQLTAGPVKRFAEAAGIPVMQPVSLRNPEEVAALVGWQPDLIVVAAFGQILPQSVLDLPKLGCLNVHASLLPRWRGASPIATAILAGDERTGVTIIRMDAGVDTGPILAQRETRIDSDETAALLGARLAEMGGRLLVEALPAYLEGELVPRPQPAKGITLAPSLTKSHGEIDWSLTADQIDRLIRAFSPWPGTFTTWKGKTVKVLEAIPLGDWSGSEPLGTVVAGEVSPLVVTGDGVLWLTRLQLAGKKAMNSDAFTRGQPDFVGATLGVEAGG